VWVGFVLVGRVGEEAVLRQSLGREHQCASVSSKLIEGVLELGFELQPVRDDQIGAEHSRDIGAGRLVEVRINPLSQQ
jgi:hypothetical protein